MKAATTKTSEVTLTTTSNTGSTLVGYPSVNTVTPGIYDNPFVPPPQIYNNSIYKPKRNVYEDMADELSELCHKLTEMEEDFVDGAPTKEQWAEFRGDFYKALAGPVRKRIEDSLKPDVDLRPAVMTTASTSMARAVDKIVYGRIA